MTSPGLAVDALQRSPSEQSVSPSLSEMTHSMLPTLAGASSSPVTDGGGGGQPDGGIGSSTATTTSMALSHGPPGGDHELPPARPLEPDILGQMDMAEAASPAPDSPASVFSSSSMHADESPGSEFYQPTSPLQHASSGRRTLIAKTIKLPILNPATGQPYVEDKPPFSYPCIIGMAMQAADVDRLTVGDIYDYMKRAFPYFGRARAGWKNSVRHNLSLNKFFAKRERRACDAGKGCVWGIADGMEIPMDNHIRHYMDGSPPGKRKRRASAMLKRGESAPSLLGSAEAAAVRAARPRARARPRKDKALRGNSGSAPALFAGLSADAPFGTPGLSMADLASVGAAPAFSSPLAFPNLIGMSQEQLAETANALAAANMKASLGRSGGGQFPLMRGGSMPALFAGGGSSGFLAASSPLSTPAHSPPGSPSAADQAARRLSFNEAYLRQMEEAPMVTLDGLFEACSDDGGGGSILDDDDVESLLSEAMSGAGGDLVPGYADAGSPGHESCDGDGGGASSLNQSAAMDISECFSAMYDGDGAFDLGDFLPAMQPGTAANFILSH